MQFLRQVVGHYFGSGDIRQCCFVFPNRRSMVFFRKYLSEEVASSGRAMFSPGMYTMNDFFYRISGVEPAAGLNLLLELYKSYCKFASQPESLDEFIFWGGVLLGDFNDVDKYLVNPKSLFSNIAQLRQMKGDLSFLSETQRKALDSFLRNFNVEKEYKLRFRRTWDILLPLYEDFRERLTLQGKCYEGMVYRQTAERLAGESVCDVLPEELKRYSKFVFVGLNALNECEKTLMRSLRNAGMAEFCWDYSSQLIKAPHNRSSFFMRKNVEEFPAAFEVDSAQPLPAEQEFNVVSVPSGVGQAKQLPAILEKCSCDINTAIVLPDENLLLPVLNSIPDRVEKLNVTMGYPVKGSEFRTFMEDIAALQMHLRRKDGKWFFYHRQVSSLLSNSLLKSVLSDNAAQISSDLKKNAGYYVPAELFNGDELLSLIFRPVATEPLEASALQSAGIAAYLQEVVCALAVRLGKDERMAFEIDFAKEFHSIAGTLRNEHLPLRPATFFRLFSQLSSSLCVPYRGEPLEGLQIMGPLETRALDFDNLIILNFNEGAFPGRNVAASFIPPELRRGFDLPTYEYQDAVWAYYFYRMIQRSRKLWFVYDSRSDGLRSGEPSRFLNQLEIDFKVRLNHFVASSPLGKVATGTEGIPKTAEDIAVLHSMMLSPSSLKDYLDCPARFYYSKVKGLKSDDEVAETLDAGKFGDVFHKTMFELYNLPSKRIGTQYLQSLLESSEIENLVDAEIRETLKLFELTGRNIIDHDIVCRYVRQTLRRDLEYLQKHKAPYLTIIGLEQEKHTSICGFNFIGYLDRLDSVDSHSLRIVDYKTGRVEENDLKIDLQLYVYDRMIQESALADGRRIYNSIYQTNRLFTREVEDVCLNEEFCSAMDRRLEEILTEIDCPEKEWSRCKPGKTCEKCKFKQICGR